MYRTLIAAAALATISLGASNASLAQEWNIRDWSAPTWTSRDQLSEETPTEDVEGQLTGEETQAPNAEEQGRCWGWHHGWHHGWHGWHGWHHGWHRPVYVWYRPYCGCR